MRVISDFPKFKDFIQLTEPFKCDGFEVVGYFPYSIASISNKGPKVSRNLFKDLEEKLRHLMDNKIVIICRDLERFGTDNFAIQFHDYGCRIGKLEDVVGYGGRELTLKQKEEETKKEQEEGKIQKELFDIHNRMVKDFNDNPYHDKYETKILIGSTHFLFRFENGDKLDLDNNGELIFETKTGKVKYILGVSLRYKFIEVANQIQKKGKQRPFNKNNFKDWSEKDFFEDFFDEDFDFNTYNQNEYIKDFFKKFGHDFGYRGNNTNNSDNSYTGSDNKNHPKWQIYQTIVTTVSSRREHLSKLSQNHPDRPSLINELEAAINKMNQMRKKYGF